MLRRNLRQKTYGVFIRPYFEFSGDRIIHRNPTIRIDGPCPAVGGGNRPQVTLVGGEAYMLNYTSTSFTKIRERVKELMNEIGFSINDIYVAEIVPINHIITPLS